YTRRHLQNQIGKNVSLHTIYYLEGNAASGGKLAPRLVGFLSTVEREFFELFCSVDGVGVKKALRAMTQPVQDTAVMIEQQDTKALSALPGVGPATAERMVAKLRRKMPKFALLVRRDAPAAGGEDASQGVVEETYRALLALGHAEADARRLVDQALASGTKFKDTETLIQLIYRKQFG
ncbi:MAG: Holliday junction branch migration protein RuvA, partial [Aureliella sp.]